MNPADLNAGVLDDFQGYLISQIAGFMFGLGQYHQFMFGIFIFIVLCLLGANIAMNLRASTTLLTKLMSISIFVWLSTNWVPVTDVWSHTMAWAGTAAGGNHMSVSDSFSSSRVFGFGMTVSGGIIRSAFSFKALFATGGVFIVWIYALSAVLVLAAFGFMAIQVFMVTTLFQIMVMVGLFLLPFAIWKRTAFIVEPMFGAVAGYGVSMMVMAALTNLIVGYGFYLSPQLASFTAAAAVSASMFALCAMGLAIYGRKIGTEVLTGSPSIGAEEALNTTAASVRMLATATTAAVAAAAVAGTGAAAVANAAGTAARRGLGGDSAASGASAAGGAGPAVPELSSLQAAGTTRARFQSELRDADDKGARVSQEQNSLMGHNVHSMAMKRIAKGMLETVGKEGGLSEEAGSRLRERMDEVQQQHTSNVARDENGKPGMDSALAAGIANKGYREAIGAAVSSMATTGEVTAADARESSAMHMLSSTTASTDVAMANRMGIVSDIHKAAVEGKSSRDTMEGLGDRMKPIEDAAIMNGNGALADVHKMGVINSVREALGVPDDKQAAQQWAKEQRGKEAPKAVASTPSGTVRLSATNSNRPAVPEWLARQASRPIMPQGTNGHGGYRSINITGE